MFDYAHTQDKIKATNMKKTQRLLLTLSIPTIGLLALSGIGKTSAWFTPTTRYLIAFQGLKGEGDMLESEVNAGLILESDDAKSKEALSTNEEASVIISEGALTYQRYYNLNFWAKGEATVLYNGSEIGTVSGDGWNEYLLMFLNYSTTENPTVTFIVSEGNNVVIDEVNVILASKVVTANTAIGELPTLPEKEGYTAVSWMIGEDEINEETIYTYTSAKLVTPKYEINTYTVTFEESDIEPITVNWGDKVEQPDAPIKDGYTFIGWYNGEEEFDFSTPIKEDLVLTPKFEINTYTVSFENCDIEPIIVNYGDTIEQPEDPTKKGYDFVGWYLGDELFDFSTPINEDITLSAKFEKKEDGRSHGDCGHGHRHHHHCPWWEDPWHHDWGWREPWHQDWDPRGRGPGGCR